MAFVFNSNTFADAVLGELNTALGTSGLIVIKDSGGTTLATCTLSATAFGSPASGGGGRQITINTVTEDSSADATGTMSEAEFQTSGGVAQFTLSVSATGGGGDLQFPSISVTAGETVNVTGGTITVTVTTP